MIKTFSKFYYLGTDITDDNNWLDFNEGAGELSVQLAIGSYTISDLCLAIKTALDGVGTLNYTVSFNRSTRQITIAADGTFSILKSTGSHFGKAPWSFLGFTQTGNLTGSTSYLGATAAGESYEPQFKLQSYVATEDLQEAVEAVVNETASGEVEVVKFGTKYFAEMNITLASDLKQDGVVIKNNPNGVADLRKFLRFLVTKAPIEFMADESAPAIFQKLILESTPESQKGVGFRLRELYDRNLPGYFESGLLKFRLVE